MVRFARADGSKGSNKRQLEEPTPWAEMVAQQRESKKQRGEEVQSSEGQQVVTGMQTATKRKKSKKKLEDREETETPLPPPQDINAKGKKKKIEKDEVQCTVPQQQQMPEGKKKKKKKERVENEEQQQSEEQLQQQSSEGGKKKKKRKGGEKVIPEPEFTVNAEGKRVKVFRDGTERTWFDLPYEESSRMTRYESMWVKKEMVEKLDLLKASLQEEGLDKEMIMRKMMKAKRKAHRELRIELIYEQKGLVAGEEQGRKGKVSHPTEKKKRKGKGKGSEKNGFVRDSEQDPAYSFYGQPNIISGNMNKKSKHILLNSDDEWVDKKEVKSNQREVNQKPYLIEKKESEDTEEQITVPQQAVATETVEDEEEKGIQKHCQAEERKDVEEKRESYLCVGEKDGVKKKKKSKRHIEEEMTMPQQASGGGREKMEDEEGGGVWKNYFTEDYREKRDNCIDFWDKDGGKERKESKENIEEQIMMPQQSGDGGWEEKRSKETYKPFQSKTYPSITDQTFQENELMTQYDGFWVLRDAVGKLEATKGKKLADIYAARVGGSGEEKLTQEEQVTFQRAMKKEKRFEHKQLVRKLAKMGNRIDGRGGKEKHKQADSEMLVKFDGYWVKKESADRLYKLRKRLVMEGLGEEEVRILVQKERRKEERLLRNERSMVCLMCRQPGHMMTACPSMAQQESGGQLSICYTCGSTEHTSRSCNLKKGQQESFSHASCFICGEAGHISRQCPDNPRGLYPKGGACRGCGSVEHLAKDCPDLKVEKEEFNMRLGRLSGQNLEALDVGELEEQAVTSQDTSLSLSKGNKVKVVKF